MMEQAQRVVMQPAHRVGEHREEGNVEGKVWACVLGVCAWQGFMTMMTLFAPRRLFSVIVTTGFSLHTKDPS